MIDTPDATWPAAMWLTLLFSVAVALGLLVKLWLAQRQMRSVAAHRGQVPEDFADRISLESHQKAATYTLAKLRFGMLEACWGTIILIVWTLFGGLNALILGTVGWLGTGIGGQIALVLAFFLISTLLELPWSWWSTFRLEAHFGFNRTTPALWLRDLALSALVGVLLGVPLLALVLWLMQEGGALWWLWAWAAFAAWQLLIMTIYPLFIAPIFNKFKPLENEDLLNRARALMQRCGFKAQGFFVMDGSRRSAHANAYFTGFGKSKRVVFFDTLLEKLTPAQIEAVLAHELGHFHHHHIVKRIAMVLVLSLAAFALLGWLVTQPWFYLGLGVTPLEIPSNAVALILFMLAGPAFGFFTAPLMARASRHDEFQADAYAALQTSGDDLRGALLRLYQDNASTLTPDPVYAAFYYSHPPAVERLAHLARA